MVAVMEMSPGRLVVSGSGEGEEYRKMMLRSTTGLQRDVVLSWLSDDAVGRSKPW